MTLKELMQALVETEDQMERMSLIEANATLLVEPERTASEAGEDFETKYNELKKKYIDTFFSGTGETEGSATSKTNEEDETTKAESITIDDVLKGGK